MEKIKNNSITIKNVGEEITVYGWASKVRNLGGLIFIDLRDKYGIVQLVIRPENEFYEVANTIKNEYVLKASGKVVERESKNTNIETGEIEIEVSNLEVLNTCEELPFMVVDDPKTSDDNRLKYRYIDIRRDKLKKNLMLRSDVLHFLRNKMYDNGFTEVQTPILTASSPEGARDFVVPSRLFKGKFYALPQAPQIYKELLMVGGFEKYFQIAPCFRDEDARADRTLEFYQLDLEMSFIEEDDILNVGEEIFYDTFTKFSNKKVSPRPFRRIAYKDAIDIYGSDKPDLRFEMEINDITNIFENTDFTVFKNVIENKGIINAIVAKNASDKYSRKQLDELTEFVKSKKASGLAYLKINEEVTGSIAKVVSSDEITKLKEQLKLENNDLVFIVSGARKIVKNALGQLRLKVANDLDLIDKDRLELCIINDFPMFEYDEQKEKWDFCHNPFSLPHDGIHAYENTDDLESILAYQFDFVCNGNEMASGAIRNHDLDSLAKGFEIVGYTREEVENRFKSIFTAFKYGCPPHGGMAPGIDRILMLIQDEPNLREVQAFPPSASGADLMMGSPSTLTEEQLEELGIEIKE
ncbi:MAG: aspartate--tRNA ligase [Firmicutes bacterium]|nr:aspartate--tRNA ligase [Bacillota bacterium]